VCSGRRVGAGADLIGSVDAAALAVVA